MKDLTLFDKISGGGWLAGRKTYIGAVVIAVLFALLWVLKSALTPLAAAFVLAYLLDRYEFITLPGDAKPGIYALQSLFKSGKGGFEAKSTFLVEGDE